MSRKTNKLNVDRAELLISVAAPRELPPQTQFELSVVGRSNVGKSSLINYILNRKGLAHTSRTPGRTRLANYYQIGIHRGLQKAELQLVDLPGYGYAKIGQTERRRLQALLQAYLVHEQRRGMCLLLIDGRRAAASEMDQEIFYGLSEQQREPVIVLTKMDQIAKAKQIGVRKKIEAQLEGARIVISSAQNGIGRGPLWELIWAAVHAENIPNDDEDNKDRDADADVYADDDFDA